MRKYASLCNRFGTCSALFGVLAMGAIQGCAFETSDIDALEGEDVAEAESAVLKATGEAARFIGYYTDAVIPVTAEAVPQGGMTMSLWFNVDSGRYNHAPLAGFSDPAQSSKWDRSLYIHGGKVSASVWAKPGGQWQQYSVTTTSAYNYADSQWHHAAFVLGQNGGLKLYVDGTKVNENGAVPISGVTGEQMLLLARGFVAGVDSALHGGTLDDVRVYTTVLSEAEIQGLMYQEIPGATAGLFGYWRLNNSGSMTVVDESPNGRHGQFVIGQGVPSYEPSYAPIYNVHGRFDGVNEYVTMGDKQALDEDISSQITLESWIYPTQNVESLIINNEGRYAIKRKSNGAIAWAVANTSPGWTEQLSTLTAPLNQWSHVALVYDAGIQKATLYVNGIAAPAVTAWGPIGDYLQNYNDFRIGARQYCSPSPCDGSLFFAGEIDEVRVWNIARSQADIQNAMFKQISGATAGLKGYWTMNETLGPSVNDSTMGKNNGTYMNGASPYAANRSPLIDVAYSYYNGHAYIFNTAGATWDAAKSYCAVHGYSLVTTNDAAEEVWLEARQDALSGDYFWIGLNDRAAEGVWVWDSGQSSSYTNWSPGEPNDNGGEDCAADHFYASGVWNDIPCAWTKPFVCESP